MSRSFQLKTGKALIMDYPRVTNFLIYEASGNGPSSAKNSARTSPVRVLMNLATGSLPSTASISIDSLRSISLSLFTKVIAKRLPDSDGWVVPSSAIFKRSDHIRNNDPAVVLDMISDS